MKNVYYEKIQTGKTYKYVPVAEYDSDLMDSLVKGNHLVMCYPGGVSRRFNIDPDYAAMIAAGRVAEDAVCAAICKASELRSTRTPITVGQQRAWKRLAKELGTDLCLLSGSSAQDIASAAVMAMQAEADKLMKHPGVKQAYEQFMLACALTKKQEYTGS
jgi:hypothetical protein